MSYIGNEPTSVAFLTDTFSGDGSDTTFTLSAAPATTSSILVSVTGVLQDPSTYSVSGTTLTFSAAPPTGTSNISVRFLGIPASGVTTTAYRTVTEFTATAGQTTFSVPSYTIGFIDVYRNGVMLGSADYTASNGVSVVLASGATAGDLVEVISFSVSSVLNAIPSTAGAVTDPYILSMAGSKLTGTQSIPKATLPTGSVLQVVQFTTNATISTTSNSFVTTGLSASITPTASTSRVLILVSGVMYTPAATAEPQLTVYRGGSNITASQLGDIFSPAGALVGSVSGMYVDSPATTSSTTYTLFYKQGNGGSGAAAFLGVNNCQTNIILMEIAS
jgi:hypothetical protein